MTKKYAMKLKPVDPKNKYGPVMQAIRGDMTGWLYLKSADVDANGGRGSLVLVSDIKDAKTFGSPFEAMDLWNKQSSVRPLRPDGQPNKPLTAYHAAFEHVP
jgi:hypothetical protein